MDLGLCTVQHQNAVQITYHSDLSDGGGHMSDTGRSVKSHISDASHITHFTEAHSVVSDGHQSAVSMDVNPRRQLLDR